MFTLNRSDQEASAARAWDEETAGFLLAAFPAHLAALQVAPGALTRLSARPDPR